ncbi:MAG TPA: exodeoxyribonuclease VII large subunit [Oceanospirillales bacterium]|nr:exodeoxyribonuclease VII large subunit [Oleispira sp.]HCM04627.1 exodeoxyribonuclease VII large subunit [Oceanospirillales bacterium]
MLQTGNDVFTVSQLNQRAKQLLEITFSSIKVEGEISNLSRPSSGHWYFTLKDKGAQVRCAMFRSRTAQVKFQPKEGDQIVVRGKVSLYENRGDYQLIVDAMKPAGEGQLQQAFILLKQKLGAEGLFNPEYKQALPEAIKRIAVITSPTGAAIHDILTVLKRRFPAIEVNIYPVQVQGKEAAQQMIWSINQANLDACNAKEGQAADVVIIGRGGGSIEDLWSFNDEQLARTIFNSKLPIVSAVGHEVDFTIADFVADARAPTPSAAAEMLSPNREEYLSRLNALGSRLENSIQQQLQNKQWQLQGAQRGLQHPGDKLSQYAQTLDMLELRMQQSQKNKFNQLMQRLTRSQQKLQQQSPTNTLQKIETQLAYFQQRLNSAMKQLLANKSERLQQSALLLNAVSPLQTLGRGYAILQTDTEAVIRDSHDVKKGDLISARIGHGKLELTVEKVKHERKPKKS